MYLYVCIIYNIDIDIDLYIYIYISILLYFYIGQIFKEVNLAGIKNCLTLVVKVKSLE